MYDIDTIQAHLLSMQDLGYKAFQSALIPSISPDAIIGVRTPLLRKYAKELYREGKYDQFLSNLPHRYYEENNLHAFLIEQMRDFNKTILALEVFLPYVDNWSTCDSMVPRLLGKYPEILFEKIVDIGQHLQIHKFLYKCGFPRTHRANHADINISARTVCDIFVHTIIFHQKPP